MEQLTHHQIEWERRAFPLVIACDDWRDPRNVGMAFRLADAFGAQSVWLGGDTPVPPNRKISKTARSTDQWIPFQVVPHLVEALTDAKAKGWTLLGLEITDESSAIYDFQLVPEQAYILVVGAESQGIQPAVLAVLDHCVHIPMYGRNTSLNVATALAIALSEWGRRFEQNGG